MESFVANLKQQVQCSLCKETLTDPKLAYCFHAFCKLCIKTNTQVDEEETNVFKCPQCESQTLLQDLNDVEDLQTSPLHLKMLQVLKFIESEKKCSVSASHSRPSWHCIDCSQSLCEKCLEYHSKFTKNHQLVLFSIMTKEHIDMIMSKKESACKTHDDQDVQLYCKDCDVLICQCCWKDDHYINHKITSLEQVLSVEKENLEQINKISTDEKEKQQQEEIALDLKVSGMQAKEEVKELTNTLVQALRDNEQQLLNEIDKTVTKAKRNLRIIHHTTQAQDYIKRFIENGTASEMIKIRQEELFENFTYIPFQKSISRLEFTPNEILCEQAKTSIGYLRLLLQPVDQKMSIVSVDAPDVEATKKAKIVVELKTSRGEQATLDKLEDVNIQFIPEEDVQVKEINMTGDGGLVVDFIPRVAGQLTVDVKVHGNSISNSPLVMDVKLQQIQEVTGYSKLEKGLNTGSKYVNGIAVNKANSKIAVADETSHCVRVFSMEGDLLLTYGGECSKKGQLNCPNGLAFLNETDLVIVDSVNARICIVNTTTGQLVRTFGRHGNGNGEFDYPYGVHVDDDGNIIVCDLSNYRVQVFTKDGDYLYQFGVLRPRSVVTHNGLFYVSSAGSVEVFEIKDNQSPSTVTTIGGKDYTNGMLEQACGLAIDNDNNILVADCRADLIHKFTLGGRYVGRSSKVTGSPRFIVVLNDGLIICTTDSGIRLLRNR